MTRNAITNLTAKLFIVVGIILTLLVGGGAPSDFMDSPHPHAVAQSTGGH